MSNASNTTADLLNRPRSERVSELFNYQACVLDAVEDGGRSPYNVGLWPPCRQDRGGECGASRFRADACRRERADFGPVSRNIE